MPKSLKPDFSNSSSLCRFEILIPITYNDGKPIPPELFKDITDILTEVFGGVTIDYPYGTPREDLGEEGKDKLYEVFGEDIAESLLDVLEKNTRSVSGIYLPDGSEKPYIDKLLVLKVLANEEKSGCDFFNTHLPHWEEKFKQDKILIMYQTVKTL